MDRVRFGRALGYGARHAAKSLAKAVDAAAAPNPRAAANRGGAAAAPPERTPAAGQPASRSTPPVQDLIPGSSRQGSSRQGSNQAAYAHAAAQRIAQARTGVSQGRKQAGRLRGTIWSPLANFTGVVGLQVSGTFFALVAAFLSQGLWKQRAAIHLGPHWGLTSPEAEKLYLHAVAFALFAYFAVSSFVRAHLKQRR